MVKEQRRWTCTQQPALFLKKMVQTGGLLYSTGNSAQVMWQPLMEVGAWVERIHKNVKIEPTQVHLKLVTLLALLILQNKSFFKKLKDEKNERKSGK